MRVAERVRVRQIDDDEGRRLLRTVRRGTGSVVTWRHAQMVLLSAQGMPVAKIAEVSFTSDDRVHDVLHNFNADGFDSLYPKYSGGRPKTFTLPERRAIKKIAEPCPARASNVDPHAGRVVLWRGCSSLFGRRSAARVPVIGIGIGIGEM
jgi:hypothetical protein